MEHQPQKSDLPSRINVAQCDFCGNDMSPSSTRCPHCGRPSLFPNVRAASGDREREALEQRYFRAFGDLNARDCTLVARECESWLELSRPVICRPLGEIMRLASDDRELYATYYQLAVGEVRIPKGDRWDVLRSVADNAFFPGYAPEIHFAALSLDGVGPLNWGECSMTLREEMVAHRASLLEENSAMFLKRHKLPAAELDRLPPGYRATWGDRMRLVVAKLAAKITSTTSREDLVGLLVRQGATTEEDEFVEVHCFGPISIRTVERVVVHRTGKKPSRTILAALERQLRRVGVTLEVR